MSDIIVTLEFCEKCDAYLYFTRAKFSQDPWICMGHSDYNKFMARLIECGQEGFRPPKQKMGH